MFAWNCLKTLPHLLKRNIAVRFPMGVLELDRRASKASVVLSF